MSLKSIVRRLGSLVLVVVGVTVVTFVISRVVPGDPAVLLAGPRATPQDIVQLKSELGLDRPLPQQYLTYMGDLMQGDLGRSIMTREPVAAEILTYLPATLELMVTALILSLTIGVPLGVLAAVNKDGPVDQAARVFAVAGISVPAFWLGLMMLMLFYNQLDWLPGAGRLGAYVDAPTRITGLYVIDGLLTANWQALGSALLHLILPAATLALASVGVVVRIVRGSMIEALGEDYVRTARAYGVSRARIVTHWALPNAMIPFVTVLGLELASLLFGSVVIESVFAWPGMGSYALNAILNLDFPVIMGFTVIASIVYVAANTLVDLSYRLLDPRIREAG